MLVRHLSYLWCYRKRCPAKVRSWALNARNLTHLKAKLYIGNKLQTACFSLFPSKISAEGFTWISVPQTWGSQNSTVHKPILCYIKKKNGIGTTSGIGFDVEHELKYWSFFYGHPSIQLKETMCNSHILHTKQITLACTAKQAWNGKPHLLLIL